jgi:hypothetical protein
MVGGQPGQKACQTPSSQKKMAMVLPVIPAAAGSTSLEDRVSMGKK